jgi:predicted small secreted protein
MKRIILLGALLLGACRKPDPEVERALDQLQAAYRRDCVAVVPESAMVTACTNAMRTLSNYGRMR